MPMIANSLIYNKIGGQMIVLNVYYKCKKDMRDEFLEMIITEGIDAASRAEEGNIMFSFYQSHAWHYYT